MKNNEILDLMSEAVGNGRDLILHSTCISEDNEKHLTDNGYKVNILGSNIRIVSENSENDPESEESFNKIGE